MAQAAGERVAYFNGQIVPERDVRVPFRDRGFKYGDAVFDTTRTFGHRIFRLEEHLERLYRSLRYLRIDPGIGIEDLKRITEEVLHRNLPLLEPDDDYWVTQRVTRGLDPSDRAVFGQSGPTVIVECLPLPLRERATLYRDGIRVVVPSVRRAAPDSLSARTKTNNYLNVVMGDLEAKARDPEAWAILLDVNGNLAEGIGSNVFLVRDGAIYTPREQFVLPGISRETAIELGTGAGLHRPRARHRPLRRVQRRRGLPHLDQPLRLPGAELQRGGARRRAGSRDRSPGASSRPTAAWSTTTSSPST